MRCLSKHALYLGVTWESLPPQLAVVSRGRQSGVPLLQVKATLKYGDLLQPPDMVSSTAFDRDDEYFATAGVSRRIKACCCSCIGLAHGIHLSLSFSVPTSMILAVGGLPA